MALLRKLFYRKPPDGLLEISDRVYVFDSCFGTNSIQEKEKENNYKGYMQGVANKLREQFPDARLLVFNFRQSETETETEISKMMYDNNMTIMDYPRHYEGCPILSMDLIFHFLRSTESWLSLAPHNILLMHCEHGGWPVLAFMLAAFLIYSKQYTGELRTLHMVYKQAPHELLPMLSLLNPIPSQLRYLQYVSRRNVSLQQWPPSDRALTMDCIIIRLIPHFNGQEEGCRPLFRIYAQDPLNANSNDRAPKLLFSTQTKTKAIRLYKQAESELVKIDINCNVQGDVVLECTSLRSEMDHEDIMFRIMFNTAFIRSNILMLNRDEIDTPWNTKGHFSKDFRAELLFSDMDSSASVIAANLSCFEEKQGLPMEAFAKVQEFFSHVDWLDSRADAALSVIQKISSSRSSSESADCAMGTDILHASNPPKIKEELHSNIGGNSEDLSVRAGPHSALVYPSSTAFSKHDTSPQTLSPSLPSDANFPSACAESNLDTFPSSSSTPYSSPPPPPPPPPPHAAAPSMQLTKPSVSENVANGSGDSGLPPFPSSIMSKAKARPLPPTPPPVGGHLDCIGKVESLPPPPPPPPPAAPRSMLKMCYENGVSTPLPPPPPPPPPLRSTLAPAPPPPPPFGSGNGAPKAGTSVPRSAPPLSSLNSRGRGISLISGPKDPQNKKLKPLHWLKLTRAVQGSLWAENQKSGEPSNAPEIDMSELENLFSASVPNSDRAASGGKFKVGVAGSKSDKVQLVDHRRACNCEIMLSKVKVPLQELMVSVLSLEDSALDADHVDNLIKFCPTKEEMELLKGYKGELNKLGKCEQFFLELMRVPRVEAKLTVFSFKMQFKTQVSDLRKSLSTVSSTSDQIRNSVKLKRVMQTILSLGNALNQGTARGSAVGFRLDSLLKLTETRARNNKMTLMHYLCKVIAEKSPELLDFSEDLTSMEPASKIQLKYLAEEMQAINKGLEKIVQELSMSESDGPVSEEFHKNLKEFLCLAEAEVRSLALLYSSAGRNVDALIVYFGEDPSRCPFEQVVATLLNFTTMFDRAHEENRKQVELEKKKAEKDQGDQRLST